MFTGLIEATGTVRAVASQADGAVLELDTRSAGAGAGRQPATRRCLTVTRRNRPHVMDVSWRPCGTALGRLTPGRPVNLNGPCASTPGWGASSGGADGVGPDAIATKASSAASASVFRPIWRPG